MGAISHLDNAQKAVLLHPEKKKSSSPYNPYYQKEKSRPVPIRPANNRTGQDRTGQDKNF